MILIPTIAFQDSPLNFRCSHAKWYDFKDVMENLNHPCLQCAVCIKGHKYDPKPCVACSTNLNNIKTGSSAKSLKQWRKWNFTVVKMFKNKSISMYRPGNVKSLLWHDEVQQRFFARYLGFKRDYIPRRTSQAGATTPLLRPDNDSSLSGFKSSESIITPPAIVDLTLEMDDEPSTGCRRKRSRGSHTGPSHLASNEQKPACIFSLPAVYNFRFDLFAEDLCDDSPKAQETDKNSDFKKFSAFIHLFVRLMGTKSKYGNEEFEGPSESIRKITDKFHTLNRTEDKVELDKAQDNVELDKAEEKVESYESFQSRLTEFSDKLLGSEVFSASEEVSKQLQQHSLFVLALMGNAPTYDTLDKVSVK